MYVKNTYKAPAAPVETSIEVKKIIDVVPKGKKAYMVSESLLRTKPDRCIPQIETQGIFFTQEVDPSEKLNL